MESAEMATDAQWTDVLQLQSVCINCFLCLCCRSDRQRRNCRRGCSTGAQRGDRLCGYS